MKNLLNLKGLCRSSQLALNSDGRTTVERRSNDGHVRRHLPVGLTKLLSLFLLLTLGVGQMWAWDLKNFNNPYIYFLNSQGWNKAAVIYGRGHNDGSYTKVANMGLVTNTNLYYVYINDYWGDKGFNQIAVMEAEKSGSSWGDAGQRIEDRWKDVTNKTGIKWDMDMSDDYSTYYITSTGSDNIDMTCKSTSATGWTSIPKCTTTLQVQTRNSTGTYTTIASSAPATLTIGGTYLSGNGSSTTAYDANNWPIASTFNSVISGLAKVKYASMDSKYQFDGWYVSGSQVETGTEYTFNQTSNTTVVAKFTRVKYTVTFDQQSGSGGSYSVTATYNSAMPSATMPTRSGYTFAGYYTGTSGSGTKYYNADGTSAKPCDLTGDIKLYAKWTQTVTLDANTSHGGSGSDGSATATWNGTALSGISHPSGATGYTRTGYFTEATGGTKVLNANGTYAGSDISGYITSYKWSRTSSTTLYAQWDNHYTVTLDNQSANSVGTEAVTATYGSAMPAITVPKKTGYIFGGYYTGTNGGGTQYYNADGTSARTWNIDSNTTLYAKWTGITYHVEFNANGGTGSMEKQNLVYGTSTALTTNTFTRSGYYFLGWNTTADGSGTALHNGRSVTTMTSRAGQTITLYAQWAQLHTLYFVQAGCNWNPPYAYATITYDGQTYYPLETGNGTAMTSVAGGITLTNVSYNDSHSFGLFKIDDVPEGSQINFNNNSGSWRFGSVQSWSADKPYLVYGNSTWYALDEGSTNTISAVTTMSVKMGSNFYPIDKHGEEQYAIAEFPGSSTWHGFIFHNWLSQSNSGCSATGEGSNIPISNGESNVWTLDNSNEVHFQTTVKGEYKFALKGYSGNAPQVKIYYPVAVNLALDKIEAKAGSSTTVTLTASPQQSYLITSPTYYYQMSTDGGTNWTTIATSGERTYAHTFAATTCKFRVILQNDEGLKSSSDAQDFTAYSTKSFYVYNPYTSSGWSTLHLYTYDSNDGDRLYNGSWPGQASGSCEHGNAIVAKGGNWYYITIDERANYFMLVGDETYSDHQTMACSVGNYIADAKYMIFTENNANYVREYQAKGASDLRLKYTDGSGKELYSDIYNTTLDGTSVIASLWMNASASSPTLVIQRGNGTNSWTDAVTYSSTSFTNLIPEGKDNHGYVFQMDLHLSSPAVSNVTEYTGPFYVRTNGLDGGWNDYKKADHLMVNSEASLTAGSPAYNYYLCKWTTSGTNVKFTVANDYNKELVASLVGDVNSTDPLYNTEYLPANANVRFAWNSQTNTLTRAYLSGSTSASDRFLVLEEKTNGEEAYVNGKIYNESGVALTGGGQVSGLNEHELLFADNGNWVYQLVMQANPGAKANVTAKFNNKEQDFMTNVALIGGTGSTKYTYRITYDFKTNVLTNAWVPDATINTNIVDLNSNVMLIRNGQDAAEELKFGGDYSITGAKKLISVMQFDYDNMVDRMGSWNSQAYQYCMYYISFPFDVEVSDIFGIGTYGTDWKLQYYDGAERASKGFFRGDGTTTFWKDVPANGKLDKYVGYSLLLNRIKFNDGTSDIWENKAAGSSVYLYFPSSADAGTIKSDTYELVVPEHECTLPQSWTDENERTHYHRITDSHWNMIGVPILANSTVDDGLESILGTEGEFRYLYAWNYGDNSLSVADAEASFTFQAMKAYMVQYHGKITFTGAGIYKAPAASVAARRAPETRNLNIELQVLNADEQEINHTYVKMQEGAEADFKLNEDLCMVTNSRAVNIYTYAGSYDVAANVLPVENTTIPVGVLVNKAGTYSFTMPSNFSGEAILVDTYAQTRTNLALEDYEVQLEKGAFNDRFYLELDIRKVPTAIDGVTDGNGSLKDGKAHKFIENGVLYIVKDGQVFDARGNKVK